MKTGLVSLVMPVWEPNLGWLNHAVEAALGQRNCEVELIVVDDGCPKPISDLLTDFEDPRLRIIKAEHGGASRARNRGIAEASGDYLRFIDADDAIAPDSTAILLDLIDGRDDLIAYGATLFCDERLNGLWTMTSNVQGDAEEACLLGHFTTRPHAFLFPRPVVEAAGPWSGKLSVSDDWDFILRALEHAEVRGTHEVVTFYRRHPGGITADWARGEEGATRVVDRYFERHPERRGTSLERRARAGTLAQSARVYATNGEPWEALRRAGRAARLDPRALWFEAVQGMPALSGMVRRKLRRPAARVGGPSRATRPRPGRAPGR
jgi:glycosyltransferase involved in cell wall biosynthesis